MGFITKTVRIFTIQLQKIIGADARLFQFTLKEESVNKNEIKLKIQTQRNEQLIRNKAMGIAKLRFKDRRVANVEVKGDDITIKFIPKD